MDREQVLQLYDAYSDDVYRLACSYLLDPHNAQDAVQEVFLRLLERPCAVPGARHRQLLQGLPAPRQTQASAAGKRRRTRRT